jgi:hypothetical protein
VFRAALFSIVLTLAVGQNADLLCEVWCHDPTSAGCPHQGPTGSLSVGADDSCANVVLIAAAFVGEDARRTSPSPDAKNALVVPRFRFAAPSTDSGCGYEAGRLLLLDARPLLIALRI